MSPAVTVTGTAPGPQDVASGELRTRVLRGIAIFFATVMAVVTLALSVGGVADGDLFLRLAILAVALPATMFLLAREIIGPAIELERTTQQLRTLYSQARLDALLDPITGLGNHRAFQEELHRQTEDAKRHGHPLALVMIDLDDLKRVNDELGHAGGDLLLAAMGRLMSTSSRPGDRAFRIGGDEFALMLPRAAADDAHAVVRRILASALSADSTLQRAFSFSAGISDYPALSADARLLIRNADAALYWAKRHGRTDVQIFDPEKHGVADDRRSTAELAEAVDRVIAEGLLTAVYQPILDLETGRPVGFEGLVRPTADASFRDAGSLFAAAEVAHRTVELDLFAISTIAAGLDVELDGAYLSVNLSPRTLETDLFRVSNLVEQLARFGLEPSQMVLELTEREAIEDLEVLQHNLAACHAEGFRIAADDVGAGNAGLRLLSAISFDLVKIDLSLVQGGVLRDSAVAVLRAIQGIAERSDAIVIAEGIETVEQLEVIRSVGIARGQGFLLALPAPNLDLDGLDIHDLLSSHQQRRRTLLNPWEALSGG
ncbi:MAG: EAL domain-containing protein [Chloroflexi bacterium]|nr:EAL domain-containing protein [Chloroflexota bacterium]